MSREAARAGLVCVVLAGFAVAAVVSASAADDTKKAAAGAKAWKPLFEGTTITASATASSSKGTKCRVVDEAGAVIAEHTSEGTSIKCMGELRELVKKEKCEPNKKLAYKFIGEAFGKEMKPTGMNIVCPRK